jgi:hypothetical protein
VPHPPNRDEQYRRDTMIVTMLVISQNSGVRAS